MVTLINCSDCRLSHCYLAHASALARFANCRHSREDASDSSFGPRPLAKSNLPGDTPPPRTVPVGQMTTPYSQGPPPPPPATPPPPPPPHPQSGTFPAHGEHQVPTAAYVPPYPARTGAAPAHGAQVASDPPPPPANPLSMKSDPLAATGSTIISPGMAMLFGVLAGWFLVCCTR